MVFVLFSPFRVLSGFAHTDPTLTVLTAAKIQIYSNKCGVASPWGPDKAWGNDGSLTAAVLVGPAATNLTDNPSDNLLGDFESTSAIPEINIAVSSVSCLWPLLVS